MLGQHAPPSDSPAARSARRASPPIDRRDVHARRGPGDSAAHGDSDAAGPRHHPAPAVKSPPSPGHELALRVLACEAGGSAAGAPGSPAAMVPTAERVIERLHEHLARWFGSDGFRAVLGRSLERARALHPELVGLTVAAPPDYRLNGLAESGRLHRPEALRDALVALVGTLFDVLARLIGDDMVARFTYQIWPGAVPAETNPGDARPTDTRAPRSE